MNIEGQPMLLRQLRRLRTGLEVAKLVVATSVDPSDDQIEQLCKVNGFECFRGPLDDVMLRFIRCGQEYDIDFIIRVGGDDPLIDPQCCNHLMELHSHEPYDFMYASNREGWPYGCAAELISLTSLEQIHAKTSNALYLEHTIPYFFDYSDEFTILKVKAPAKIHRPNYYFSVDYRDDLEFVRTIYRELSSEGDYFPLSKIIQLIDENPELRNMNSHLHSGFER